MVRLELTISESYEILSKRRMEGIAVFSALPPAQEGCGAVGAGAEAMKTPRGMEHLLYEERQSRLGLFILEKALGRLQRIPCVLKRNS